MMEPAAPDPFVGAVLDGGIALCELIGAGTMGRVYLARSALGRDLAVKVLRPELAESAEAAARFHREARIARKLKHPNLVQVVASGTILAGAGAGTLYLVMEYLRGKSLAAELSAAGGGLPLSRSLDIAKQICDGVGEAHANGIVHRDLKPENAMLVGAGDRVKVLDFGVARVVDSKSAWTGAGLIFGSAAYISPEGAMGEPVGPAADVYSIAVMLYQCLCGRTPFVADAPVKLLLAHAQHEPPPLAAVQGGADVPPAVAELVMRCLAKDPQQRPADARELGELLRSAMRGSGLKETVPIALMRAAPASPSPAALASPRREALMPKASASPRRAAGAWRFLLPVIALVAAGEIYRASAARGTFERADAELHACMAAGAWLTPPERNVRAILERLDRDHPGDARVGELRREAGERLLADALRLKYAGETTEAALRARLAMDLAPELQAAPKLYAELRQGRPAAARSETP